MQPKPDTYTDYIYKRTLFLGDINSGKTYRTMQLLQMFINAGYGPEIAVFDLAPDLVDGVGGKMKIKSHEKLLYLTTSIAAPRLQGQNEEHTWRLAQANAQAIERLFDQFKAQNRKIVFINDATLYLQAGSLERLAVVLNAADTVIMNAYWGDYFADSVLTRREKQLTHTLQQRFDRIIRL